MPAATAPLLEWVRAHASSVTVAYDVIDPVSVVALYGNDDRSIVAQCDIEAGKLLVTVEPGAFLNGSSYARAIGLSASMETLGLTGTVKTTLALLAEVARGDKSDFYGYIQQLPTTISLPLTWDENLCDMLRHTTAYVVHGSRQEASIGSVVSCCCCCC